MSIRLKLTIMFLALSLIPTIFVASIAFTNYESSLEASKLSALKDIAGCKVDRIEMFFQTLKDNIRIVQNFGTIKKNLPILAQFADDVDNLAFTDAREELDTELQEVQSVLRLFDIMLVNPEGKIVYSSNPDHKAKDFSNPLPDSQNKAFLESKDKIYFTDIFSNKVEDYKPAMLVSAPLFDSNGIFIGVIAFEVDMVPIYSVIQDVTGLGNTGETLLGKKVDSEVVFLNPLRHDSEAALKRKVKLGSRFGIPMQESVQGKTGVGQTIDYRGKKVISAWRYIPSLDWGIVAKIDSDEVFLEVIRLRRLIIGILIIVLVLVGIMAFSIAWSISRPIQILYEGVEAVGTGDLNYKIGCITKDEIGHVCQTFDKMTVNLRQITASRDELNEEISRRKIIEESLRELNNFNQVLLFTIPYGMDVVDEKGNILFINKVLEERISESWVGKKCWEVYRDDKKQCDTCPLKKGIRVGETASIEVDKVCGGRIFQIAHTGLVYKGEKAILEIFQDITDRKKAEDALRTSEVWFSTTLRSIGDGVIATDHHGSVIFMNPVAESLTGWKQEDAKGLFLKDVFNIINEETGKEVENPVVKVMREGKIVGLGNHTILIAKDGRKRPVDDSAAPIKDTHGTFVGVVLVFRDVTSRREQERKLQEAIKAKSAFTSMVSHELRTPLAALKEGVALVSDGTLGAVNEEQKRLLELAKNNAERLARLINEVLNFQMLEVGKVPFKIEENNLNRVIQEVWEVMSPLAKKKNLDFTLKLDENLPKVRFDRDRIIEVLSNLVNNSLRLTEKGGITISTKQTDDAIQVSVKDTGPGIREEDMPRLFQQYEQLERKTGGTGLGLAISLEIIKAHDGKIWAESKFGEGTTFHFVLPKNSYVTPA